MSQYVLIEVRLDVLIGIFGFLFLSIIWYYLSGILKRVMLKIYGFKYQKKQGLKVPKKLQDRYIKNNKNIRVNTVDNISILSLVIWLTKGESSLNK